jgi:hypothetical protein
MKFNKKGKIDFNSSKKKNKNNNSNKINEPIKLNYFFVNTF